MADSDGQHHVARDPIIPLVDRGAAPNGHHGFPLKLYCAPCSGTTVTELPRLQCGGLSLLCTLLFVSTWYPWWRRGVADGGPGVGRSPLDVAQRHHRTADKVGSRKSGVDGEELPKKRCADGGEPLEMCSVGHDAAAETLAIARGHKRVSGRNRCIARGMDGWGIRQIW